MKITSKIVLFTAVSALFIVSCSRKNDSFISRNFHAVNAEYNTLFNGYNALEQGRKKLNTSYQDNYWELLPIERMQIQEEIILPGQSKNADFTRAEEKAVKAIQKHSMNIQGREKNPQIDEAYLLLGKARYFDQRFVPAMGAFNKILSSYPDSDKINQTKIWREKTNIRLENNEVAIKNLKRLLEQEKLEDQDLADATSMLAQAYVNNKHLDSALMQIKIASKSTNKNFEKGRYNFIEGQLYNVLKHKDSANMAFDEVIDLNRKVPRIYLIAAHVEKAKNFDYEKGNKLEFLEHLTKLEEDRENRLFLDKIYHQIGEYHLNNKSDSLATAYYNKSLRQNSPDKILVAKNYETLGDMYFDKNEYKLAGAYFDSTMTNMVENSKPFRVLKRKRENLDDVIYYEGIAEVNDSVLGLVKMSEAERLTYFETYTNKLKAEAKAQKLREEIEARKQGLATTNINNVNKPTGGAPGASSFYFYNSQTVAYGKNEFEKIWGNRKNADNWRWSSKARSGNLLNATASNNTGKETIDETELFDPQYYISKIPSEEKIIDSLATERNYAYYQLGLIYKEKFKEYGLSKSKFLDLLDSNPEEKLILPSKYNLYKIYELLGENDEASIAKNEIISEFPDSRYATILQNPELAAEKDNNSPQSLYESTYALIEEQKFAQAIAQADENINRFNGEPIAPKFELLKATASGRLYGFESYKKALNAISLDYANTPEGAQAKNLLTSLKPLSDTKFKANDPVGSYKVVFKFNKSEVNQINDFVKVLNEVMGKIKYYDLKSSIDVYNKDTTFVVAHGVKSIDGAKGFVNLLEDEDQYKITRPSFGISSENYKIVQIHKNLNNYLINQ